MGYGPHLRCGGIATTDNGNALTPSILGFNRAFIQWAGMTAGVTQSFYDFYSGAAVGYRAYIVSEDTGDAGWWLWACTAQLGNGLSASISAEERRASQRHQWWSSFGCRRHRCCWHPDPGL
jgi:hypothetical protein